MISYYYIYMWHASYAPNVVNRLLCVAVIVVVVVIIIIF